MSIPKQFPKIHERMSERGFVLPQNSGYLRDQLNSMLTPLGFHNIGDDQTLLQVMLDAEAFLVRLDAKARLSL